MKSAPATVPVNPDNKATFDEPITLEERIELARARYTKMGFTGMELFILRELNTSSMATSDLEKMVHESYSTPPFDFDETWSTLAESELIDSRRESKGWDEIHISYITEFGRELFHKLFRPQKAEGSSMEGTDDKNLEGTHWWNDQIYGTSTNQVCYPEEDHQIAAVPRALLWKELGYRLEISHHDRTLKWMGKEINFSAVSDSQLLHHIGMRLAEM